MTKEVQVVHPLVQHHLTTLRDQGTTPAAFRNLVQRLAVLLAYEATKDLEVVPADVQTPLTKMTGRRLCQRIGLVPILRAGLGMIDPLLNLMPTAEVWHLGLYRDEATAKPIEYYSKIPPSDPVDVALILDPMLATGGSATAAMTTLQKWGVPQIKLLSIIAAPEGIQAIEESTPEAQVFVCCVDERLNDDKFIVPGLGDAGDRIFNAL